MRKLPLAVHRVVAGIALIPTLIVLVDNLGNYRWFWPNDRAVMGITILIGTIWIAFFAPPISRLRAYRRKKDFEARRKLEAHFNDESKL